MLYKMYPKSNNAIPEQLPTAGTNFSLYEPLQF
jgi:hypothetical protein